MGFVSVIIASAIFAVRAAFRLAIASHSLAAT